jgi:hypothetical protein
MERHEARYSRGPFGVDSALRGGQVMSALVRHWVELTQGRNVRCVIHDEEGGGKSDWVVIQVRYRPASGTSDENAFSE